MSPANAKGGGAAARRKQTAKALARARNEKKASRIMGRRHAVSKLNALPVEVGMSSIPVKTTQYKKVERLMRQL